MMKRIKLSMTVIAMAMGTYSCGELQKKAEESESKGPVTELEGTWVSPCTLDDKDEGGNSYSKQTSVVTGEKASVTMKLYSDDKCTTEILSFREEFNLTIGDAVTSPAGAKKITYTPVANSAYIKVSNEQFVSYFNQSSVCGGDWVAGTEKQINNTLCKDSDGFKDIDDPFVSIFKIDGTSWYSGKESDGGKSTTVFPTELETVASVKQ